MNLFRRLSPIHSSAIGHLLSPIGLSLALVGNAACGEHVPAPSNENAHAPPTPDAGAPAAPATSTPSVPGSTYPMEEYDPAVCRPLANCIDMEPLQAFDAPNGVELRELNGHTALGYDTRTRQFVDYTLYVSGPYTSFQERYRFDAKYDRVKNDGAADFALACTGAQCTSIPFDENGGWWGVQPVPDEVEARWIDHECVGGRGIVCPGIGFHPKPWDWLVRPEALAVPIERFWLVGEKTVLAVDQSGATILIRNGAVTSIDTGTASPIVELSFRYVERRTFWLGRTADGQVIQGDLVSDPRGSTTVVCAGHADFAWFAGYSSIQLVRNDTHFSDDDQPGCARRSLPRGVLGGTGADCGIAFFDAHHVYADRVGCPITVP